jgi:hypothetical protein
MTTIVSQTASASNTKNTKENRKVVWARFNTDHIAYKFNDHIAYKFKLPDNLDLEDETIVQEDWGVKRGVLNIPYTNKENYIKYTGNNPVGEDFTQKIQPWEFFDPTRIVWYENADEQPEVKDNMVPLYEYPDEQRLENANDVAHGAYDTEDLDLSTKNTKDNRKLVVAKYHDEAVYKLPNNLDLEDKSVVKSYWIKWGVLHICYTSKENLERFTNQPEDKDDFAQKTATGFAANEWVQEIQPHWDCDDQRKFPQLTEIDDADEYGVDYEQDDEDQENE